MLIIEVILLAIVQGIGEFLPISSSGHVVVLAALFDQVGVPLEEKLALNVVLHLGTLLAILVFYGRRIVQLLGRDRRVIGLLVVGTLPAVIVGLSIKAYCQDVLENPLLAGLMFLVTAAMLLWTARQPAGSLECRDLSFGKALLIGVFQAVAILPGISRSGSTIVAGLGVGLKRDEAAAFSFLLAIPAIGGAGVLEGLHLLRHPSQSVPPDLLMLGAIVSFVVGFGCLWWLLRWLQQGRLYFFAWWLLVVGPVVIVWQLWMFLGVR